MLYLQSQTGTGRLHCAAAKLLEGLQPPGSSQQHFVFQAHSTGQPLVFLSIKPVVSARAVLQGKVSTEVDRAKFSDLSTRGFMHPVLSYSSLNSFPSGLSSHSPRVKSSWLKKQKNPPRSGTWTCNMSSPVFLSVNSGNIGGSIITDCPRSCFPTGARSSLVGSNLNLWADTPGSSRQVPVPPPCLPPWSGSSHPATRCVHLGASTHISKGAKSGLAIWYPCFTML